MATLRTVTIDPDDGGADYANQNAAEGIENGDISATGTDEYVVFECTSSGTDDTTAVTYNGWTTGPTWANRLEIMTPAGSTRHAGLLNQSLYVYTEMITSWVQHLYIHHMQFVSAGSLAGIIYLRGALSSGEIRIEANILTGAATTGIYNLDQTGTTIKIWNNIIYETGDAGYSGGIKMDGGGATCYVENNTVVDMLDGECIWNVDDSTSSECHNNIAQNPGAGDTCYLGTWAAASNNNISSDTTEPGSGAANQTEVDLTFKNATGDDYHLDPTDTEAIGQGADLSSGNIGFTNDIDGDTRPT